MPAPVHAAAGAEAIDAGRAKAFLKGFGVGGCRRTHLQKRGGKRTDKTIVSVQLVYKVDMIAYSLQTSTVEALLSCGKTSNSIRRRTVQARDRGLKPVRKTR